MLGVEAWAIPSGPIYDTLQIGSLTTVSEGEGNGIETVSQQVTIAVTSEGPTGTFAIELLDPGTTNISDIVTEDIGQFNPNTSTAPLTVTLTSDGETPLDAPTTALCAFRGFTGTVPETGAVQNLGPDFAQCFNFSAFDVTQPVVNVSSDADATVLEPSSLALLGAGLAGFTFGRRRKG